MFVLVEYNSKFNDILNKLGDVDFRAICVLDLKLNNKKQIQEDLNCLMELKKKINCKYFAIRVFLERIDNSTAGIINNLKSNFNLVIGFGGMNKINRFFVESTQIDFLQDPHNTFYGNKQDFIHHFNSGINQVLSKYARDKNIGIINSLDFLKEDKRFLPKNIGRINQNLKFARKYNIEVYSNFIIKDVLDVKFRDELIQILSIFDISNNQKCEVIDVLEKRVEYNKYKNTANYINDFIEKIE